MCNPIVSANHTHNVISGCNKRITLHWKPSLGQPALASIQNSEWSYSGWVLCSKHLASNPCQTKWPVYRGDRTSESQNSESLLYITIMTTMFLQLTSLLLACFSHAVTQSSIASTLISSFMSEFYKVRRSRLEWVTITCSVALRCTTKSLMSCWFEWVLQPNGTVSTLYFKICTKL